jgi:hypothetical protein
VQDYTKDDERAVDVTEYVKSKFGIKDCSKYEVFASNGNLGSDPAPQLPKQLRLVYSNDNVDFAYAYAIEGKKTSPIKVDNTFDDLCPVNIPKEQANQQICQKDPYGKPRPNIWTNGNNSAYRGAGPTAKCITQVSNKRRGIVGLWEGTSEVPRTFPLHVTVTQVDGYTLSENNNLLLLGTVNKSKYFAKSIPSANIPGIPGNLFWFWYKNSKKQDINITVVVPARLADPMFKEDIKLCPTGPLINSEISEFFPKNI